MWSVKIKIYKKKKMVNEKYFNIKEEYKDRWEIIKEIMKHHPGYGSDRKWSWYEGGMKDSGGWIIDTMLEQSIKSLQDFLSFLEKEAKDVKKRFDERQKMLSQPRDVVDGILKKEQEEELRLRKEWYNEYERNLMWGK